MKTQDIKNMAAAMQQVAENQKAAMQKKLAKSAASSEKGKAAVTLPKAPFDIPKEKMEAKKMDPVGQADADIDNDGDVDKSDKYLHNRRKAIGKAIKKDSKGAKAEVEMNPTKKKDKAVSADQMESTKVDEEKHIAEAAYLKGSIESRADAHEDQADHHNSQAEKAHKAGDKMAASVHKAAARAHMKAASYFDKHLSKPKHLRPQAAGGATSQAAHAATQKANQYNESVEHTAEDTIPPVYAKILENRAMHMKGATAPETMDDKLKGDGAKKMKSDMMTGAKMDDTEEKGHKDVADAGRVTKGPQMRKGDNKGGDKAVINKPEDVTQKGEMKG